MERFNFGTFISELTNIRKDIDMTAASASIRKNIFFRGPNVWILAFSIIVASVGLNVNSTAVIIGAMLISPLMGPIFGVGLGLGVNDPLLIKNGFKNLLIMVFISILASTLYFLITPLRLANPTELLARTTPSIYDVMIALFGGAAGILELCRKEKGTVLSGVAIATALMPPLCTAGYGIASGNFQYFIGAIYLFFINGIFIILATYIMVKYLGFDEVKFQDEARGTKVKRIISVVVILVAVPSIWSATIMIRDNKFAQNVAAFVKENKTIGNNYIYDYQSETHKGGKINLFITGGTLSENEKEYLAASAAKYGIKESQLVFNEHSLGNVKDGASEKIVQTIYERADTEIRRQEDRIRTLESELASARQKEIPYAQISKEVVSQYPEIQDLYIANGQEIQKDSLSGRNRILVVANTTEPMERKRIESLEQWLKIRLNDNTVVVMNQTIQ
jgi:Predicted membrane protein